MVGSSKILTVSYGTFSCTLEGFDDPFSAMKSIAEYFRDLAAEDRYFGAEPPTPDPEMLHRIAEREVRRRVEARTSDDGIVLRQITESAEEMAAPPVPPARRADPTRPMSEESVASKLSRIRAVVDRARAAPLVPSAVAPAPVAPAPVVPALETPAADYVEDEEPEAPVLAVEAPDSLDPAGDDTTRPGPLAAEDVAPDEIAEEVMAGDEPAQDDGAEDEDGDAPEAPRPWEVQPHEEEDAAPAARVEAEAEDEDDAQDPELPEEAQDDLSRRIIHLSRNGRFVPEAEDEDDEDDEDEDDFPDGAADDATLAGIRMALDAEQEAIAQERKEARMERRHVLIGGDREPALERILEETNTKMQDREGTRRRSAIAHLKAAVAATKADRMLKRERSREIDEEEQRDYREDLAKVVRPRRSEPRENAAEKARPRSIDSGTTPLILGSSQRIDTPAEDARRDELRPRRVGAMIALDDDSDSMSGSLPEDDSDFAAFAEALGARDLPDLLEAAAAYTAFVERQPSFSRPQIMRRAAAIETDEEFTREAGLRSFGQLLRQGKIRKLQRGQFTISENTRFRPESRIAGE